MAQRAARPALGALAALLIASVAYFGIQVGYSRNKGAEAAVFFSPSAAVDADLNSTRWPLIAMKTNTKPSFIISLPTEAEDRLRFSISKTGQYYEKSLTRAVAAVLGAASSKDATESVVIDVGCNAGWFAFYAAAIFREQGGADGSSRRVYCFEANPNLHPRLADTVRFNQGFSHLITLVPNAVSATSGEAKFSWNEGHYGGGSLTGKHGKHGTTVHTTTLDTFFSRLSPATQVPFLKIDVEGFECLVMQGAQQLLASKRVRNLFVEVSFARDDETNCTAKEWLSNLMDMGYELRTRHRLTDSPILRRNLDVFLDETRVRVMAHPSKFLGRDVWLRLNDIDATT